MMDVKEWQAGQVEPFRQAVAGVTVNDAEVQVFHQHLGQLQGIVALLLENRPQQAMLAWNSLHLKPALKDLRLADSLMSLVPQDGPVVQLKLDEVIDDLQRMLDARAVERV